MQNLRIIGLIDQPCAERVHAELSGMDSAQPLTVSINSDGGSVQHGIAIYNTLANWPGHVTTVIDGWALSIASVIAQAGKTRLIHPTGAIMVHAPWLTASGNAEELRNHAQTLDLIAETMLQAYRKTGKPEATIRAWLDGKDHWMTAAEAVAAGLVDSIIADQSAGTTYANASATRHSIPDRFKTMTTTTMPTTTTTPDITAAERNRKSEISAMFYAVRKTHPEMAALATACENDPTCSPEEAGRRAMALIGRDNAPANPIGVFAQPASHHRDRLADYKAAATDVLLQRAGIKVAQPHPAARDLSRESVLTMAENILSMSGRSDVRNMGRDALIQAAMSTSDFPQLLSATAKKAMAVGYENAPNGHALFTSERDVTDFKASTLVNMSEAPGLLEVPELAEYKAGAMEDSASTFKLATFGRVMHLSRQALVNDDLGAFTMLPASFGAAARRLEADKVFGLLTDNPAMGDGKTLFHADHGNVGVAAKLSLESLGAARAAMRKQKGIAGLGYIDPQPRFLIVPVGLETTAEQLIASLVDPSRSNATPSLEFVRGLTLIADPRLDENSETAWYLAADPRQIDTIARAYLVNQPRPYLEENQEFLRDALSWKVRLDFAAGVMNWRGLFKNPGL